MEYGYFDDENREYVITKPDTPRPWANYLGDTNYGAIITNNAGGYSFVKSGANGRILRYLFNHFDEPGRYIYLKDLDDNDYWSTSYRPVLKDLNTYKNECRHGLGYSTFITDYKNIHSEVSYYVPLNKAYEIWHVKLKNNSKNKRKLAITAYCEFTSDSNYEQDLVNLQYSQFITKTQYFDNYLIEYINPNFLDTKGCEQRFFALANSQVKAYCGDKDSFLGNYHSYQNPLGVIEGLKNTDNFNYTACGALQSEVVLEANEEKTMAFILGSQTGQEVEQILNDYKTISRCENEIQELKEYWANKLANFQVTTPSKEFNSMINIWHAYNCYMTFNWSRAASLIYCGLRNGYGYRDTVQDIQGIIHLDPSSAKEKISFMLSAQVNNGAGLPLVKYSHNPGHEDTPDEESYVKETGHPAYRADDALWLFPTVYKYICESGDLDYLDEVIPYANKDQDSVYEHLKKAIHFTSTHLGKHDMPAGLYADWNDCLRLGKQGESTFVAMQFLYALKITKIFAEYKNDISYLTYIEQMIDQYTTIINQCYDEDRYLRGYTEDGKVIGAKHNQEANMWLNPQSWSVISGLADKEKAHTVLDSVYNLLNTKYGVELMNPPFRKELFDGALAACFNPGNKENSSIFLQTQGWLILAESLNGNGQRAYEYYKESCPAYQNNQIEIRQMEPYCYGQFTEGRLSPKFGRSNVHWLTGTASTIMVGVVEGILGIRPDLKGLKLEPALPNSWPEITINKIFRNKKLTIHIHNKAKENYLILNGLRKNTNYIKEVELLKENVIELYVKCQNN